MKSEALLKKIERRIFLIRGQNVMLDFAIAELYGVETGALNRAVKRNADRFPADFMFQLSGEESDNLRCQIGISSGWGGRRRSRPYAFTEQGVAMLSSVLRSPRTVQVYIAIPSFRNSSLGTRMSPKLPLALADLRPLSSDF
jgi:hypothetical protein